VEGVADNQLAGPIKSVTEALDGLQPGTVERWLKVGSVGAAMIGGMVLAKKGVEYYQFGRNILTGGKQGKSGGLPGLGGSGGSGPIPVYVVNLPGQGVGVPGGGGTGIESTTRRGSKILQQVGKKPSFLKPGTIGRVARMGRVGATLAATVGTASAGATAGAALASGAVGYAVGTGINKLIGKAFEAGSGGKYKGSGAFGELLYDLLHKMPTTPQKEAKVGGEVRIKIESDTPTRVTGLRSDNRKVPLNVDSGLTMRGF
jgi:hypothetical protein